MLSNYQKFTKNEQAQKNKKNANEKKKVTCKRARNICIVKTLAKLRHFPIKESKKIDYQVLSSQKLKPLFKYLKCLIDSMFMVKELVVM